ncbi:hypothetical protein Sango_2096600 [Sesamum angolense]|uniref:Uncharacterized protein n=1 Tax=Sesamum angolense TaxID=2727404 RepID=A0AAE2BM13_9LAMI|nr:hypothetical protein Sango_2096600 [Sesamum angolense]
MGILVIENSVGDLVPTIENSVGGLENGFSSNTCSTRRSRNDNIHMPLWHIRLSKNALWGIEVDQAKIDVIKSLPYPASVREIHSFLGHAGFYRRFVKDFSKIAQPLSKLLRKDEHSSILSKKDAKSRLIREKRAKIRSDAKYYVWDDPYLWKYCSDQIIKDYVSKWVEAKATCTDDAKTDIDFVKVNIFSMYGMSMKEADRPGKRGGSVNNRKMIKQAIINENNSDQVVPLIFPGVRRIKYKTIGQESREKQEEKTENHKWSLPLSFFPYGYKRCLLSIFVSGSVHDETSILRSSKNDTPPLKDVEISC